MATRYLSYAMIDGKTRLGVEYFNPVWKDIDVRLDKLENKQISWDEAVRELNEFGLERIDNTIGPVLTAAQVELAEAQAASAQLQQMIEDADIQGQLDTALAAQSAAVTAELDALETSLSVAIAALSSTLSQRITALEELTPLIFAGL